MFNLVSYLETALPEPGSNATQGLTDDQKKCYKLIRSAELEALKRYSASEGPAQRKAKEDVVCARVAGGLVIHLHAKRTILGSQPVCQLTKEIATGSSSEVVYGIGKKYRDHFVYAFGSENKAPAPTSNHPSRPSFDTLEAMMADDMNQSGDDYQTARKKTLARDGYRCMVTGIFNEHSVFNNTELQSLVDAHTAIAEIQTCHILNQSTSQKLGEETDHSARRSHAGSVFAILNLFGLEDLVEKLLKKNGVHGLDNLLSLCESLHTCFDKQKLWFDQTDKPNTYKVELAYPHIANGFSSFNREVVFMVFTVNETLTKPKYHNVCLDLPDPRLLALHAVCARVAHMSGAAEYIDQLKRDVEETKVLSKDNLHLLDGMLSPFAAVSVH